MDRNEILRRRKELVEEIKNLTNVANAHYEKVEGDTGGEEFNSYIKVSSDLKKLSSEYEALGSQLEALATFDEQEEAAPRASAGARGFNATDEYVENFYNALVVGDPAALAAVKEQHKEFYNISGIPPSTGELLVPRETERGIIRDLAKESVVFGLSSKRLVGWRSRRFVHNTDTGPAAPRLEGDPILRSEPVLESRDVNINNYGAYFPAPREFMDDAPAMNEEISDFFTKKQGYTLEEYSLKGEAGETDFFDQAGGATTVTLTGIVPTGILAETSDYVTEVTAAGANAIAYDDLVGLITAVKSNKRRGASFVGSGIVETKLMEMRDADGRPLWTWDPSGAAFAGRVMGYPVRSTDFLPDLTAAGNPLIFGNWAQHRFYVRRGLTVRRDDSIHFLSNSIAFAMEARWGSHIMQKGYFSKLLTV